MGSPLSALLKQLVFGVDTISAVALCTIFGLIFDPYPEFSSVIGYLALAGLGSYLPDLDLLIYLPFRKRFNWESHWDVGHHPLIVLPLASALTFVAVQGMGIGNATHATALMFVCVLIHFIHDSTDRVGFPWLSPFNMNVYLTLYYGWPRILSSAPFHEHQRKLNNLFETTSTDEVLAAHGEPTTIWHIIVWLIAVGMFCYWVVF